MSSSLRALAVLVLPDNPPRMEAQKRQVCRAALKGLSPLIPQLPPARHEAVGQVVDSRWGMMKVHVRWSKAREATSMGTRVGAPFDRSPSPHQAVAAHCHECHGPLALWERPAMGAMGVGVQV